MVASVCVLGTSGLLLLALDGGGVRMALHFIHDLCAILFVIAVLAHMYLGVLLNPTSLKAIVRGVVPREWAREHHPRWLDY
jgi:formate dehydrogenase subunit gamma